MVEYSLHSVFGIICFTAYLNQAYSIETKYSCTKSSLRIQPCNCTDASDIGIKIECINTNLASLSLALASVSNVKVPIEHLLIDQSHFGVLFGNIFSSSEAHSITFINTPIEHVAENVFYGVNRTLSKLEIINSTLSLFPAEVKSFGKLTSLILHIHRITKLDSNVFGDMPISQKLERLHISNGNISDISIEFFHSLRKLKYLDLHGNQLKELKRNQFKNLRDLESLDISHNHLTKLDASHIADLTKLGWCNVSHNSLTEITRGTFARTSVLRVLNMSNNKIKRLDANSFRGMRFLRRLYLSDNVIADVGRGTFASITRIGTIDLARNELQKIDYQMFAQLNYIEHIDLAENKIVEIQKQSFKDLYLTHINSSRNIISKFELNSFENCVNMTVLDLSYNSINSFPKKSIDDLSYAAELLLSYNNLTNISTVPLANMTGLKLLNRSYNGIVEIPKNSFPKLYELHTIDASHNSIKFIFDGVFQPLLSLRYLNLSYNQLIEIKSATFGTIPTLLEINLNNNLLQKIAKGALTKLISLRSLFIENNQLTRIFDISISLNNFSLVNNSINEIAPRTWPAMNALIELNLQDNMLQNRLHKDSFSGLLSLRYLNLNNNNITIIPRESLSALATLQHLHLERNGLTHIPENSFGVLPVVFKLHLHDNLISNISSNAFGGLLQLLELDLSKNDISAIPMDAFSGLVSLRNLDLSSNTLKKLDNRTNSALDPCLSLERINLRNNHFNFITKKTFPSDPYIPYRLRSIDLSINAIPVLTKDLSFGTEYVRLLNLSYNSINEIRPDVLSNMKDLETLDISHNNIEALDIENFTFPENISNLIISNNRLSTFPTKVFKNISSVKSIDLRNNLIESFDLNLLKCIKTGLLLSIDGNPLRCDCHMRPLLHYYQTLLSVPKVFTDIICNSPHSLSNKFLYEVHDDNLNCQDDIEHKSTDLNIQPDLAFQEIIFAKGNLSVWWKLLQLNKDIAGFYIIVRNQKNEIIIEHHIPYESRIDNILGSDICERNCQNLELCVMSKDSHGSLNGWFDAQCITLPNDFDRIKEKHSQNNDRI